MNARQASRASVDDGVSSSSWSNTIWSSVPSLSREMSQSELNADSGDSRIHESANHTLTSSLSLSLDPEMVDSVLLSNILDPNGGTESAESELDALSYYSSSSISSCSVASIPEHSPHLFTNIGRALLQLSVNENDSVYGHSVSANDVSTYSQRGFNSDRSAKKEWWTKFQTEEDWEAFTEMAAQYIGTLVSAELMEMNSSVERDRDPWRMKGADSTVARYGCQRDSYSIAKIWLQRIYQAFIGILGRNAKGDHFSRQTQMKMNYISYLVRELAAVQQKLNTLPPIPPTLPGPITLGELPEETRNLITRRCSAWREETNKERELLELKQSNYREEILSAIIETEEELFWSKDGSNDKVGSCNDGYFLVAERDSPYWNGFDGDGMHTSGKLNSLRYLIALTAGAAGIVSFLLQSKKR